MSAAIRLMKKIIVEKRKKNLRFVSSSILEKLKIFKPDDVSCIQCRIEANEMKMEAYAIGNSCGHTPSTGPRWLTIGSVGVGIIFYKLLE